MFHTTSALLLHLNIIYRYFMLYVYIPWNSMRVSGTVLCCFVSLLFKASVWTYARRSGVRIPFSNIILLSVISTSPSGSSNVRSCHIFPVRKRRSENVDNEGGDCGFGHCFVSWWGVWWFLIGDHFLRNALCPRSWPLFLLKVVSM